MGTEVSRRRVRAESTRHPTSVFRDSIDDLASGRNESASACNPPIWTQIAIDVRSAARTEDPVWTDGSSFHTPTDGSRTRR